MVLPYMNTGEPGGMLFFRLFVENFKHLDSGQRNSCAGTEDSCYASLVEEIVVLSGDNAARSDKDIFATKFLEFLNNLRDESLMTCGER